MRDDVKREPQQRRAHRSKIYLETCGGSAVEECFPKARFDTILNVKVAKVFGPVAKTQIPIKQKGWQIGKVFDFIARSDTGCDEWQGEEKQKSHYRETAFNPKSSEREIVHPAATASAARTILAARFAYVYSETSSCARSPSACASGSIARRNACANPLTSPCEKYNAVSPIISRRDAWLQTQSDAPLPYIQTFSAATRWRRSRYRE